MILFAVGLFAGSLLLSVVTVRLGIPVARRLDFTASSSSFLTESSSLVPKGGGISLFSVFLVGAVLLMSLGLVSWRFLLAVLPVMALGVADDVFSFSPGIKFALQWICVVAYTVTAGIPAWLMPVAGLFLVGSQNAWNLVDAIDGLMASVALVTFVASAVVLLGVGGGLGGAGLVSSLMAGAVAGFLVWNRYPARVFMGDSGTLPIGVLFGVLVVETGRMRPQAALPLLMAGAIPFFEAAFLVMERTRKGVPFHRSTPDHLALRMLSSGIGPSQVLGRVRWVSCGLLALSWLVALRCTDWRALTAGFLVLLLAAAAAFRYLARLPTKLSLGASELEICAGVKPSGRPGLSRSPVPSALTFDVEPWYPDVGDAGSDASYPPRMFAVTDRLLNLLERYEAKATFFVLGDFARRRPEIVRAIHAAGHEIGSHGSAHEFVYRLSPARFRNDLRHSVDLLQQIVGESVRAYRAPHFSITRRSLWALDILHEEGVWFDSSVFPVRHPQYGIPGACRWPHRLISGLWEWPPSTLPTPLGNLPFGGGFYLRVLPEFVIEAGLRILEKRREPAVIYLHLWELDCLQSEAAGLGFRSLRRHYGLRSTAGKLVRILCAQQWLTISGAADRYTQGR